ncbi:MAG: hypothetical protein LKF71_01145 [Oscillospiraceae bacterium]|jgi:hypothetical protein|nr:hypothetical protein [Oscillospiraceae bacterium]
METAMNGYGEGVATFACSGEIVPGTPVMVTADGTVAKASGVFCGVAISCRDGYAAVQLDGYVSLPYSGTKPTVGYQVLTTDADGKIETTAAGTAGVQRLVVNVDSTHIGFIL